jgi:hypothetical protein
MRETGRGLWRWSSALRMAKETIIKEESDQNMWTYFYHTEEACSPRDF